MSDLRLAAQPSEEFGQASLLPPNRTRLEEALEKAIRVADPDLTPVATLMNPAKCPEHLLSWLAWAFSVDVWDEAWTVETKRNVLASSVEVHRRKGTVAGVKRALAAAGYSNAQVLERYGWEVANGAHLADGSVTGAPRDHWAEYRVRLKRLISIEQAQQVRAILSTVAPVRSSLKALEFRQAVGLANGDLIANGNYSAGIA